MTDMLTTDRTYATRENAEKALARALEKTGIPINATRYLIATSKDGRFAPIVLLAFFNDELQAAAMGLAHAGVTVVS